mmetsp:Transcript_6223/g.25897  ORF Transcript_6223/g.25897 Transcript_6223/m.25897 type:complete len:270 (+) Transcript_6223:904-1713(+)
MSGWRGLVTRALSCRAAASAPDRSLPQASGPSSCAACGRAPPGPRCVCSLWQCNFSAWRRRRPAGALLHTRLRTRARPAWDRQADAAPAASAAEGEGGPRALHSLDARNATPSIGTPSSTRARSTRSSCSARRSAAALSSVASRSILRNSLAVSAARGTVAASACRRSSTRPSAAVARPSGHSGLSGAPSCTSSVTRPSAAASSAGRRVPHSISRRARWCPIIAGRALEAANSGQIPSEPKGVASHAPESATTRSACGSRVTFIPTAAP